MTINALLLVPLVLLPYGATVMSVAPPTPAFLFRVFAIKVLPDTAAVDANGPVHHVLLDTSKPLLTVSTLRNFLLEPDRQSVRVVLNDADAKTFAKISFENELICVIDGAGEKFVLKSEHRTENGSMSFGPTHHTGPLADYLRERYQIKPGTNAVESVAPSVQAPAKNPAPTH